MARKNIKRPRLNSRRKRRARWAVEHPSSKEVLLGFHDNVINHLGDLQRDLEVPSVPATARELEALLLEGLEVRDESNKEVIRLDEEPVLKTGAGEEPV